MNNVKLYCFARKQTLAARGIYFRLHGNHNDYYFVNY